MENHFAYSFNFIILFLFFSPLHFILYMKLEILFFLLFLLYHVISFFFLFQLHISYETGKLFYLFCRHHIDHYNIIQKQTHLTHHIIFTRHFIGQKTNVMCPSFPALTMTISLAVFSVSFGFFFPFFVMCIVIN